MEWYYIPAGILIVVGILLAFWSGRQSDLKQQKDSSKFEELEKRIENLEFWNKFGR